MKNQKNLTTPSEREKTMKKNNFRYGSIIVASVAAIWLVAGCGSAPTSNGSNDSGGGDGGGGVESTSSNEASHAEASGTNTTGELNITTNTSTTGSTATTATTATSTTTTTAGQTATYTVAFTVSAAPTTITTTIPTFSWVPASAAYKVYVTLAGSTTIKWGLKCATGTNCINSPVSLGDQSVTGATVTPIGSTPTATTLAAGTYNVVVETASTTGTISQAGWTAFTVQ